MLKKIESRIEELTKEIEYEKRKMDCCAYGKSDLMYLYGLEAELEELESMIEKLEEEP